MYACMYVCDGQRVDEVNEVDRIVAWKAFGGECEGGPAVCMYGFCASFFVSSFFVLAALFRIANS